MCSGKVTSRRLYHFRSQYCVMCVQIAVIRKPPSHTHAHAHTHTHTQHTQTHTDCSRQDEQGHMIKLQPLEVMHCRVYSTCSDYYKLFLTSRPVSAILLLKLHVDVFLISTCKHRMCSYVCACLAIDINLDLRSAQIIEFSVTMPYQCISVVCCCYVGVIVEDVYDLHMCWSSRRQK